MQKKIDEFISKCNDLLQEAMAFSIICRDTKLQKAICERLRLRLLEISELKMAVAKDGFDDIANMLLGTGCALSSVMSTIQMCLNLKVNKPHEAWQSLVGAQRAVKNSIRAHSGCEKMIEFSEYLSLLEHCMFPPQVFTSIGASYSKSFCSICDEEYENCDHLVGMPYAGEFCCNVIRNSVIKEISIVDLPADKGCIVTTFRDSDRIMKDRLSLLPVEA